MKKLNQISRRILLLSIFLGTPLSFGNEYVIRLNQKFAKSHEKELKLLGVTIQETLIPQMEIYSVVVQDSKVISQVRALKFVNKVMPNVYMRMRERTPNEEVFPRLWNFNAKTGADVQAQGAWQYTVGGPNPKGQDVVVAVVDGGVDVKHEDLVNNIWVNTNEIPGNGVDDDENGYIDDMNGWNAYNDNGAIPAHGHGTHVAGIIGSEGNNGKFGVGVNWKTKIMAVAGSSGKTSVILKAYGYVLSQKKLWLATGGVKGANVVATNSSFGVDRAKCNSQDYSLWNDVYNAMGEVGILSAAAGPNSAWDVDSVGDVPTSCDSPYIVAVTNTTAQNTINGSAGFGKTNIDIGAPGTNILSTIPGNQVGEKTGTSMATPHVAGAIGLLYSVYENSSRSAGQNALAVKEILLKTATPMSDLQGRTVSGGRLNLQKAVEAVVNAR